MKIKPLLPDNPVFFATPRTIIESLQRERDNIPLDYRKTKRKTKKKTKTKKKKKKEIPPVLLEMMDEETKKKFLKDFE